jgi:hypothetical protein
MVDYSSMSRNWYAAILNYCLKVYSKKIIMIWFILRQNILKMMTS